MSEKSIVASILAVSFVAAAAMMLQTLGDAGVSPTDGGSSASSAVGSLSSVANECAPYRCADGTVIASCTPDGHVINYFADPCLTHGGYASSAGSSAATSCEQRKDAYDSVVDGSRSCDTDADCSLFVFSCPFVTCGIAITASAGSGVLAAAQDYAACRQQEGSPLACAMCAKMTVSCVGGKCVATQGM